MNRRFFISAAFSLMMAFTGGASAQTPTKITRGGDIASLDKAKLLRAIDFVVAKDKVGFERYLEANPDVFFTKGGVPVYVEDATFGGLIKIRPVGEIYSVWTVLEAVK